MAKAKIVEVDLGKGDTPPVQTSAPMLVDFDPQSLRLSYSNNNNPAGTPAAGGSTQKVSAQSVRLTLELLFDSTDTGDDVREKTKLLTRFIVPNAMFTAAGSRDWTPEITPPGIQFQWGSLIFTGTMDSMDETLDYFGDDGVALRSSVSLSLSSHEYRFASSNGRPGSYGTGAGVGAGISAGIGFSASAGVSAGISGSAGVTATASVQAGASLQGMAGGIGASGSWKGIAAANGIDNPLRMRAGAAVNLNARAGVGAGVSAGVSAGASAGLRIG